MDKNNTAVAVFDRHNEADNAVRKLADSGFPIKSLSVIGKGYHTEEKVVGFYNMGERVTFWGKRGAIWGGLWGWLLGGIFMTLPVIGPVVVVGYFATVVLAIIEGAAVVGGLSALAAALYSIGIPKDSVVDYENALKAEEFVVLAQGSAEEVERAREILHTSGAKRVDVHSCEGKNIDMPKYKAAS
jgi:hypothetical protein